MNGAESLCGASLRFCAFFVPILRRSAGFKPTNQASPDLACFIDAVPAFR
jgi:hypothetical protein